jgi:hypothetical protein
MKLGVLTKKYSTINFYYHENLNPHQQKCIVTCIPIARQRLGKHVPVVNTPQQ